MGLGPAVTVSVVCVCGGGLLLGSDTVWDWGHLWWAACGVGGGGGVLLLGSDTVWAGNDRLRAPEVSAFSCLGSQGRGTEGGREGGGGGGEGELEKERQRQSDRQTDRQTGRKTD